MHGCLLDTLDGGNEQLPGQQGRVTCPALSFTPCWMCSPAPAPLQVLHYVDGQKYEAHHGEGVSCCMELLMLSETTHVKALWPYSAWLAFNTIRLTPHAAPKSTCLT